MKTLIYLLILTPLAAHAQKQDENPSLNKQETLGKFGQTPEQIRDYFKKLGNTRSEIVVGKHKLYSPLNLAAYLDGVEDLQKDLGDSADGVEIQDKKGRTLIMIPVATMFIALKSDKNFPEANAALGYILTDNNKYIGVFTLKAGDEYIVLLKNGKTAKIEARDGALGFESQGVFMRIKSLEFDT
jgi:hypothetical protein